MIINGRKIRVLIVDDSAVVRQELTQTLNASSEIEVIASVPDPIFAMARMNQDWPDVVVLDIEMPRMDGITFLKKLMSVRPTPTIVCSTLTEQSSETTMQAMACGAVGVITKPKIGLKDFLADDVGDIVHAVKSAALTDMRRMKSIMTRIERRAVTSKELKTERAMDVTTDQLIAIGTSTGGTQALELVLTQLPRMIPGIVIVQHMPEKFTGAFAARLNKLCQLEIKEAANGDRIVPGYALIAPGGKHMSVRRNGAQYIVEVKDGPLVNRHRPSVDVLFRSVAKAAGKNALGIIMTGMGDDGARGLREMLDVGARTAAQNERSCVVYGMPKEAVRLGAVEQELDLNAFPEFISQYGRCRLV